MALYYFKTIPLNFIFQSKENNSQTKPVQNAVGRQRSVHMHHYQVQYVILIHPADLEG